MLSLEIIVQAAGGEAAACAKLHVDIDRYLAVVAVARESRATWEQAQLDEPPEFQW